MTFGTDSAHVDQSSHNLNLIASPPDSVAVSSTITYECDANKFLNDWSTSYQVLCKSDMTFDYDPSKHCKETCAADPPAPTGVVLSVHSKDHTTYGYWEGTVVR